MTFDFARRKRNGLTQLTGRAPYLFERLAVRPQSGEPLTDARGQIGAAQIGAVQQLMIRSDVGM
jgi:hypothetical protein